MWDGHFAVNNYLKQGKWKRLLNIIFQTYINCSRLSEDYLKKNATKLVLRINFWNNNIRAGILLSAIHIWK